ncbi:3-hydroxybutyryl-CoA dehydrogenase [Candidatus Moduliflexus flocculans]|uniref:3-hydroxybutyryl-CoA dehydrogenase n=1 Tax=Candidatus Moduliflexus flocculans TaxID=1499966 RepID=A0A081BM77_9BACT|nr:3-hydroxybutyryl-CoA dehydrogenase [Candidatus Moduliflexus flocculans]
MQNIRSVGVVGCGLSGCAIARVVALAGYEVQVCERSQETLDLAFQKSSTFFKRESMRGALSEEAVQGALSRIHGTTNLRDLAGNDIIIEATSENFAVKQSLLQQLDQECPPTTLFVIHTSSLSIAQFASASQHPERVIGLHFIHPIHIVKLAEIVTTPFIQPETLTAIQEFVRSLQKMPITVKDAPGLIVSRLMIPYLLNAVRLLEEGIASAEDIDAAMQIGCGHPIGPLALLDYLGIDHVCRVAENLHQQSPDPDYLIPELLKMLLKEGYTGRQAGKGFYTYSSLF